MLMAGMVVARTTSIRINFGALLVPLHDPVRVAEDLAVLDLASGGRVSTVAGLGYRPSEYHLHGGDRATRGRRWTTASTRCSRRGPVAPSSTRVARCR